MKDYYVYILANYTQTTFYTGITSDLTRRIFEHKNKILEGFTKDYNVKHLLYYEIHNDIDMAIIREKRIKKWKRSWKLDLIRKVNPEFIDLYNGGNILPIDSVYPY